MTKELSEFEKKAKEQFDEEERKRKEHEVAGHVHNCEEAGCTVDPDGKKL